MSLRCAVIGNPIAHSLSPVIHQAFAKQFNVSLSYEKIQGEASLFEQQVLDFFASGGKGLNVTLPYKQRAFAMAATHTMRCLQASSANTLWLDNQVLHADNTDGVGLVRDLKRHVALKGSRMVLLGAGGAARGVIYPLLAEQPKTLCVAHRREDVLKQLKIQIPDIECIHWPQLHAGFDLVINATSASIIGDSLHLPDALFVNHPFCYDLMYDKDMLTPFVADARQRGCQAVDGLGMLIEQAAEAFYLWHGVRPDTQALLI